MKEVERERNESEITYEAVRPQTSFVIVFVGVWCVWDVALVGEAEGEGYGVDEGGAVVGAEVADELFAEVDGSGFKAAQVAPDYLEQ